MSLISELDKNHDKESTIILSIRYAGPAVEGSIDATDLGESIIGFEKLLQQANFVINGSSSSISSRVQTNFKNGSFTVYLEIAYFSWALIRNFLNGSDLQALKTLCQIIGIHPEKYSLIELIKKIRKNTPEKEKIKFPENTWKLYNSPRTKHFLNKTLSPLEKSGVEEVSFHIMNAENSETTTITKQEYPRFKSAKNEKVLITENIERKELEVIGLNFEKTKWTFRYTEDDPNKKKITIKTIQAELSDQTFISKVIKDKISFRKGDTLICQLHTKIYETPTRNITEYEIAEIIHFTDNPQLNFNF